MKVFGVSLPAAMIDEVAAHAERDYPVEACGVVLGQRDGAQLARVVPLKNVQDRYHQRDPDAFPRTGRDAFRLDELERARLLESEAESGLVERILYHSHCDAGAYFSPEDRAMAVRQGVELMPGIIHVVASVRNGKAKEMAAFRYDTKKQQFEEVRLHVHAPESSGGELPDLSLRAMEGRQSVRPVQPVGGALLLCRLTSDEEAKLAAMAEGRKVKIESPAALEAIRCFELGFYSPLTGFMRSAEIRSVLHKGRLQVGTPWRVPVVLEVPKGEVPEGLDAGGVVELVNPEGQGLALMAVEEVEAREKGQVRLGGRVYAYPRAPILDAADRRARLLESGAKRVLAVEAGFQERLREGQHDDFDVVLSELMTPRSLSWSLVACKTSGWLSAAMAQNQGATDILVEDPSLRKQIEDTLQISPWSPETS